MKIKLLIINAAIDALGCAFFALTLYLVIFVLQSSSFLKTNFNYIEVFIITYVFVYLIDVAKIIDEIKIRK